MATEKYTTLGATTLNTGYTSGGTSLDLVSGSSFPSAGNFRVRIDDEIFKCTARSGGTITCVGAQEGTSAANHLAAAPVTEIVTAAALDAIRGDMVQTGVYSSAAFEKVGNLYLPTDTPVLMRDNGASFDTWGPLHPLSRPVSSNFAWRNQGTATITDNGGSLYLTEPTGSGGYNWRVREINVPSAPYKISICFRWQTNFVSAQCYAALILCDGTKLISFGHGYDSSRMHIMQWSTVTAFGGQPKDFSNVIGSLQAAQLNFLQIHDDNAGNRNYNISVDGKNWMLVYTESNTAYLTPTKIGFGINTQGGSTVAVGMSLFSWKQE